MRRNRKEMLEKSGWTIGSAAEFLGMSPSEEAYVELKLSLAKALRAIRTGGEMTQEEVAKKVGSSQSRVGKMEAAEEGVSLDLLVRTLLALGETPADLARHFARPAGTGELPGKYAVGKRKRKGHKGA